MNMKQCEIASGYFGLKIERGRKRKEKTRREVICKMADYVRAMEGLLLRIALEN